MLFSRLLITTTREKDRHLLENKYLHRYNNAPRGIYKTIINTVLKLRDGYEYKAIY